MPSLRRHLLASPEGDPTRWGSLTGRYAVAPYGFVSSLSLAFSLQSSILISTPKKSRSYGGAALKSKMAAPPSGFHRLFAPPTVDCFVRIYLHVLNRSNPGAGTRCLRVGHRNPGRFTAESPSSYLDNFAYAKALHGPLRVAYLAILFSLGDDHPAGSLRSGASFSSCLVVDRHTACLFDFGATYPGVLIYRPDYPT